MRDPFGKVRYVDRFRVYMGAQFATIMGLDTFLRRFGYVESDKVEIIALSQWTVLIGLSQSRAMNDSAQASECVTLLNEQVGRLFDGLSNGVKGSDGQVLVPLKWLSHAKDNQRLITRRIDG